MKNKEFKRMQKIAGIQLNENMEMIDRMEGLANERDLVTLEAKLRIVATEWMQEGFEKEDIKEYMSYLIDTI